MALFHLHSLKCTTQFMVCIQCSKLIYRYCNETSCALLVHPCRWSWRTPFFGLPAPCPIRFDEPLTLILLQGARLIEKFANARCFPPYRFIRRRAHRGLVYSSHSASQCATRTSMNHRKARKSAPRLVTSLRASRCSFIPAFHVTTFFLAFMIPIVDSISLLRASEDAYISDASSRQYHLPRAWAQRWL